MECRVVELTAAKFGCWVDVRFGIRAQPHSNRDMIRHDFTPLSMGDAPNLMREFQPSAGLHRTAHAARRPDIIIGVGDGPIFRAECSAAYPYYRCRNLADWAPYRVRRKQVEIARKESLGAFKALIQPNEVGS